MNSRTILAPLVAAGALTVGCAPNPETNRVITTLDWQEYPENPQAIYAEMFPSPDDSPQPLVINLPGGGARFDSDGDGIDDDGGALCNTSKEKTENSARFFQSLGYAAISVDMPIYPAPDPFCKNPGQDVGPYLEAFGHYQQIIEDTVVFAKKNQNRLGWDGEHIGIAGYSFGATAAQNTLHTEFVPDAIIATSGYLQEVAITANDVAVLRVDYQEDTGFVGFENPDPLADCATIRLAGNICTNLTIEGAGHVVFPQYDTIGTTASGTELSVAAASQQHFKAYLPLN